MIFHDYNFVALFNGTWKKMWKNQGVILYHYSLCQSDFYSVSKRRLPNGPNPIIHNRYSIMPLLIYYIYICLSNFSFSPAHWKYCLWPFSKCLFFFLLIFNPLKLVGGFYDFSTILQICIILRKKLRPYNLLLKKGKLTRRPWLPKLQLDER